MKTVRYLTLIAFALILLSVSPVTARELGDNLAILGPFIGETFVGHYSNPEDSHYVHVVTFEPILDGQAVRMSKTVDELSFAMETLYYWDEERQQVAFLSTTNKGQVSRGVVLPDNGRVVLQGESVRQNGNREYKQSYHVSSEGTLEDRFFLKSGDAWQQRHLIVMKATKGKK